MQYNGRKEILGHKTISAQRKGIYRYMYNPNVNNIIQDHISYSMHSIAKPA